jgi:hypothetical protein
MADYEITLTWDDKIRQQRNPDFTGLAVGDTIAFKGGTKSFRITFVNGSPFPGVTTISDSEARAVTRFQPRDGAAPESLEFHCEIDQHKGGAEIPNPQGRKQI